MYYDMLMREDSSAITLIVFLISKKLNPSKCPYKLHDGPKPPSIQLHVHVITYYMFIRSGYCYL